MLKQLVITIALFTFLGIFTIAQDKTGTNKKECSNGCCSGQNSHSTMQMSYMDSDSTHGKHHKMKTESMSENSIVHEGDINLAAIDQNKDGKVFQDQMCWNVISDNPGECPQCGMILQEVLLDKAKENLLKHDYKVK